MAHVEFTYTGASPTTLEAGEPPFRCRVYVDLYSVGSSRGEDFTAYGTDGDTPRARERGPLAAELIWDIYGTEDMGGAAASDEYRQARLNVRDLVGWFDAAPGKRFTVTLVDGAVSWTGDAAHQEWGHPEYHGSMYTVRQLIVVPAGVLTVVA